MATTLTIKPGGGGDYPDAATWEADLDTGDQIGECYRGDIGAVAIDDANPDSIVLQAADGEQHGGVLLEDVSAIAHCASFISVNRANVALRGLYTAGGVFTGFGTTQLNNTVYDRLLAPDGSLGIDANGNISATGCAIRNCVAYVGNGFGLGIGVSSSTNTGTNETSALTIAVENNSVYLTNNTPYGIVFGASAADAGDSATLNLTLRNNVVIGASTHCFGEGFIFSGTGSETENITSSNNASSDETAEDFGGTGHLVGQSASEWFSSATNLALKAGAPGIDAGATIAAVTHDVLGVERPQGAAYDIGAFELVPRAAVRGRSALRSGISLGF